MVALTKIRCIVVYVFSVYSRFSQNTVFNFKRRNRNIFKNVVKDSSVMKKMVQWNRCHLPIFSEKFHPISKVKIASYRIRNHIKRILWLKVYRSVIIPWKNWATQFYQNLNGNCFRIRAADFLLFQTSIIYSTCCSVLIFPVSNDPWTARFKISQEWGVVEMKD